MRPTTLLSPQNGMQEAASAVGTSTGGCGSAWRAVMMGSWQWWWSQAEVRAWRAVMMGEWMVVGECSIQMQVLMVAVGKAHAGDMACSHDGKLRVEGD